MTKLVAPKTFDQEFNVRAFGATGDGTTEDYAAMQAAFNALNTNGGGTLIIPPGTYIISQTLTIGSAGNIHIKAHGATIKRSANPDGAGPTKMYGLLQNFRAQGQSGETSYNGYNGVKNILIEGGIWDVNGRAGGPTDPAKVRANGIMIAHSTNVIIRDITVLDVVAYHAIEINSTDGAVIENCTFSGFNRDTNDRVISAALQLDYPSIDTLSSKEYDLTFCKNVLATGITVKESADNGSYGRFIESHSSRAGYAHSNVRVIGNHIRNTMDYAMDMDCWRNVTIANNIIDSCNGGIKFELPVLESPWPAGDPTPQANNALFGGKSPVQNIVITGNVLENMGVVNGNPTTTPLFVGGIYILGASAAVPARNINISNNTIRKYVNSEGIAVQFAETVNVSGNNVSESTTGHGISVLTSSRVNVNDNILYSIGNNGIRAVGPASDVQISDNSIKGAGRETNNTYFGISLTSAAATVLTDWTIKGNKVRYFGDFGNDVLRGIDVTNLCSVGFISRNNIQDTGIANASTTPATDSTIAKAASVLTAETNASSSYGDLATVGPSVTVNTGTSALVVLNAQMSHSVVGGFPLMAVAVSGATTIAANDDQALGFEAGTVGQDIQTSSTFVVTGLTPGANIFTAKYRTVSGTATSTFRRRHITVIPLGI